jgi:hypothetical protein
MGVSKKEGAGGGATWACSGAMTSLEWEWLFPTERHEWTGLWGGYHNNES